MGMNNDEYKHHLYITSGPQDLKRMKQLTFYISFFPPSCQQIP